MSEVLPLLQQRLHKGAANAGVAVSVHPVGEPRARDAALGGVAALDHAVVSVAPFLHCFHDVGLSASVLLLVSRCRQWVVLTWQVGVAGLEHFFAEINCAAMDLPGRFEWQVDMKKADSSRLPHPSFFLGVSRLRKPQLCGPRT